MKKSILLVAAIFSMAVMFTACKETKKEEVKAESHEGHDHSVDEKLATDATYQCPMDCEKGKTYAEAGSCPVCKMDLKEQATAAPMHAEGCACKESGECTCESGKCKCMAETASVVKECGKCAPGECTCKTEEIAQSEKECSHCAPGACECKA